MSALSPTEKSSIDYAANMILKIIDCYRTHVPPAQQIIKKPKVDELEMIARDIIRLNQNSLIDWMPNDIAKLAETDSNGIHLNPDWSGDYKNDYIMPGSYDTPGCDLRILHSLWRVNEMIMHERYHYYYNSGVSGTTKKAFLLFGTLLVNAILYAARMGPKHFWLHEQQAYAHTRHRLFNIETMVNCIWIVGAECIPCLRQHSVEVNFAEGRQQ